MSDVLDPEPLLRALHDAGVEHIIIGGFAVNAHGFIRPSKDLDIVPDPDPENLRRLASLLTELEASQLGADEFEPDKFPFDPTNDAGLQPGVNFRLETRLGDLDIMQWVAGIEHESAYHHLAANAIVGELAGIPLRVCSLGDLTTMKQAAGRPRDIEDLRRLGTAGPETDAQG